MNNEKGFTLIEMLIVLFIISVLLLLTIPNVVKHNTFVDDKGCEAYIDLVQSQVQMYKLETNAYPIDLATLETEGYIQSTACPDSRELTIDGEGIVDVSP
ncbi:competence protein ComGC [Halalkalibacillus sediminis]|uniref:ComG operon protein 3 n=1 Tax=Halalkalibacillus sediminis TaxID=2018042 RepID=A0A2I0QXB8_9BACI|nr:competence type IV pilus major pilin ComGC [Halalkalibacillus sediminis]PKR78982.1 competence protein ComGC [Halalkalibacillus sediminis]